MPAKSNITLIGMPGSGKSTVGKRLAKHFNRRFIDCDVLIERSANMPIQHVVDRMGLKRFKEIEQRVLCEIDVTNAIISTGGSAIYSRTAMAHLAGISTLLYLRISRASLLRRVNNESARGLYKLPSHSLLRLYQEREQMYPECADVIFDNDEPLSAVKADQLISLLSAK